MRVFVCVLLMTLPLLASENGISRAEAQDGWILLFDGDSFFGWSQDKGKWKIVNGVVSLDGPDGGMLRTNAVFSDYILKLDFRAPSSDLDSAVFLRITKDGVPRDAGYDLRLGDSDSKWPGGSLATVFKGDGKLAPNQWHTLEADMEGEQMSLKIDGRKIGDEKDGKSKAGFIALASSKGTGVEFRNIKLKPIGTALFNGTDLSGWKEAGAPPPPPPKKGGILKKIEKPFKGKGPKQTETQWSVVNGAIHGSSGPGQLESQAAYDDFVMQVAVRVNSKSKKKPYASVLLRADPGKLASGYDARTDNEESTGGIQGLKAPRKLLGNDNEFVPETIALRGRHFEIWVNGYPVTEFDDTRPEGPTLARDAKTAAGAIALFAPDVEANLDFKNIVIAVLPKTIGGKPGAVASAAPPPVAAIPAAPTLPPPGAAAPPAPVVIQQVNPNQAKEDANKAKVAELETQALKTQDPKQQQQIYENILKVDPNNVNAAQGYRDAGQKIEQANAQQQKAAEEQARQTETEAARQATLAQSKQLGEAAFVRGDLPTAQSQLAIAEKAAPGDAAVLNLRQRVDAAIQARTRIRYLEFGGGGLVALSAVMLVIFSSGKKDPYLEVSEGLDKGKRYNLDQDVIHIGAVQEDGGSKNDIVVHDVERMISRFHCEVHHKEGKLFLIDLNSSNGTYVDKRKAPPGRPVRLKSGSQVALGGSCTLRVGFEKRKKT
jgi:hypothetical protein